MIDTGIVIKRLFEMLVLPPGGPLVCVAIGLLAMIRWPKAGRAIAAFGVVAGWALSTSAMAHLLSRYVEGDLVGLQAKQLDEAMHGDHPPGAVVVLSGGTTYDSREVPGPDVLLARSLNRIVQGARMARASGLPVLVSGGAVVVDHEPEAVVMARTLRQDFGIAPRWVESGSLDTFDNATRSVSMLRAAGIDSVILVTDAIHMRRASRLFVAQGIRVLPAPVGFSGATGNAGSFTWLPSSQGAARVWIAAHELVGEWWYQWRSPSVLADGRHPDAATGAATAGTSTGSTGTGTGTGTAGTAGGG
ncbi:MAG: YdcF family protein [Burkholderiaceae bacterium]